MVWAGRSRFFFPVFFFELLTLQKWVSVWIPPSKFVKVQRHFFTVGRRPPAFNTDLGNAGNIDGLDFLTALESAGDKTAIDGPVLKFVPQPFEGILFDGQKSLLFLACCGDR